MEESSTTTQRSKNILIAIILAVGSFLAAILLRRWLKVRAQRSVVKRTPTEKLQLQKFNGLSESDAESRLQEGIDNTVNFKPVRTRREIWRENVLSIFNLSLVGLALVQILFDRPLDALLSLGVLALSIGVNVFQEYFARRRLKDILQATRPKVTVIRDGKTRSIDADEIVFEDMIAFGPGDELLADGSIVQQSELIVDESMLMDGDRRKTKVNGDQVFAGTFCVSGRAVYQVEKIGSDRYISSLFENTEDSRELLTPIEKIINRVLHVLLIIVAIFTVILIYSYFNISLPIPVEIFNEVAGIIFSLAPAGLFFMIIVTYAASTVDIAKVGALVNRARSVEAMAQVDTVCFSREGVLTGMKAELTVPPEFAGEEGFSENRIQQILGDYVRSSVLDNQLTRAVATAYEGSQRKSIDEAPYLSVYGWNAITFDDPDLSGVYVMGVPSVLEPYLKKDSHSEEKEADDEPGRARKTLTRIGGFFRRSGNEKSENGDLDNPDKQPDQSTLSNTLPTAEQKETAAQEETPQKPGFFRRMLTRVNQIAQNEDDQREEEEIGEIQEKPPIELLFAYYPDPSPLFGEDGRPQFPIPLTPLCQLSFTEQVRPEAVPMIRKFIEQGIKVKIFAAERSQQALALLKDVGLGDLDLDVITSSQLTKLGPEEFSQAASDNEIFLHLTPEQMGNVVANLRTRGQYVAMVGDSVNDVPALHQSNLAVSYQNSSQAAQSLADILLLENSLKVLERVLDKGQRIVNGLLDILKLYLTQVFYLALLIAGIQIIGFGFPFRGIQLTVIVTVTITIPSLGLTLFANPGVLYGKSLRKSLSHFVAPTAITISLAGIFAFFFFRSTYDDIEYTHLVVTYLLVFIGLLVVLFLRPPFRLLAGGAPLSKDRRIFLMVVVLAVLFLITVAITVAIPFLQETLMLDWLNSAQDYLIIGVITVIWAFTLLVTWRIWRLEGIWNRNPVIQTDDAASGNSGGQDDSSELIDGDA